jgi:predicted amidohydrolase
MVRETQQYAVQFISFPDLSLAGNTLTAALVQQLAEPVNGPSLSRAMAISRIRHISIICTYAERECELTLMLKCPR